jgi:hypothetical protein
MTRLARQLPLYTFVIVILLAVLAYGTARRLTARAAGTPRATIETATAIGESQGQMSLHVADCNADTGPGEAEPVLASHPSP